MRQLSTRARLLGGSTIAALSAFPLSVYAAVPADVTTALGALKDDAITVATAVVVAIVAVYAFKFIRKGL